VENKIIFHANIDDDPNDFTRLQDFVEGAIDHVVGDAITLNARYTGFNASKSGVTSIEVQPGRLYSAGKVYASGATAWTRDFLTQLPVAGKRVALLVTWGSESDTDVRPRQFLINAETRQAEPQAVPMVHARVANLQVVLGAEAPDPTDPIVDAGYTVIARVVLTATGVDTVTMLEATKLPSIQDHEDRIEDLEEFEVSAGFQIKTLSSDLAALKEANSRGQADQASLGRTLQRLAVLEAKNGVLQNAVDSNANFFLDTVKSKLDDPLSHVKVEEGIRMPNAAEGLSALQIFNPLDSGATIKAGIMFPAYTREAWFTSGGITADTQISSYSQTTFNMIQKTMSRQRIRYGDAFTVCSNSLWWQTGQYDGGSRFYRAGEIYEVESITMIDYPGHNWVRLKQIWIDNYDEPYWEKVTNTISVNGAQIAQTWLQGQNMWLDAVGVCFTRLAAAGTCHVAIVEVSDFGLPNLKAAIATTTILREQMVLGGETTVTLQPTYLQAGKRYALVLTTSADHWVGTVPNFSQGTFFYVLDGAYAQGDAFKDLWFRLHRCRFNQARQVITLQPLQLSGGILAIDLIAGTIVPEGTSLSYEIQVGSSWYNLLDTDNYMLGQGGTIPPLLPFRAVFNGSVDCMPAINLLDSSVSVTRPDVSARHITQTRTLPVPSTQIRVIERYEFFNPTYHTAGVKLRTGATFATEVAPSSTSTYIDPADGSYERTYVFNLGAAVTQFRVQTELATSTNQRVFHVAWQKDYAL
jgi:hypothetical protein